MKLTSKNGLAVLLLTMLIMLLPAVASAKDAFNPSIDSLPALGNDADEAISPDTYYCLDDDGSLTTVGASASNYNIYYHDGKITLNNAALQTGLYVSGGTVVELVGNNTANIKNDAVVSVSGTQYSPAIATYSGNPRPINISDSTVWVENCAFGLSGSQINLKDSDLTIDSKAYAFLAPVSFNYSYPVTLEAGTSEAAAVTIPANQVMTISYPDYLNLNKYAHIEYYVAPVPVPVPVTGDENPVRLWMAFIGIACLSFCVLGYSRRKRLNAK